jgi:hypothetical protein
MGTPGVRDDAPPSSADGSVNTLAAVRAMTDELFGKTRVECADEIEDILRKERTWVKRRQQIAPRCDYRLSILPIV